MESVQKNSTINTCPQHILINQRPFIKNIAKVSKLGDCVPNTISEKNRDDRIFIGTHIISRQRNEPFLKNIIMCNKKWFYYDNIELKRQRIGKGEFWQVIQKGTSQKDMHFVLWHHCSFIHFEF